VGSNPAAPTKEINNLAKVVGLKIQKIEEENGSGGI
jgi:hypothetical protein